MLLHYLSQVHAEELALRAREFEQRAEWYEARVVEKLERELTTARARLQTPPTAAHLAR